MPIISKYTYVANNPINATDPLGLFKVDWGKVAFGIAIIAAGVTGGALAVGLLGATGGTAMLVGALGGALLGGVAGAMLSGLAGLTPTQGFRVGAIVGGIAGGLVGAGVIDVPKPKPLDTKLASKFKFKLWGKDIKVGKLLSHYAPETMAFLDASINTAIIYGAPALGTEQLYCGFTKNVSKCKGINYLMNRKYYVEKTFTF